MYIIPGYTNYYEKNGAIFVSSSLFQNEVKLTDPIVQTEFRSIVKSRGCKELTTPLSKFLHEQELIANETEIKLALAHVKELLEETLLLTIMPTEGCNFRCPYCYENHNPISMTRQVLDAIQAYISKQASKYKSLQINWFGGEPTLCRDTILETSQLVQSLQTQYHFQYASNMTTNGYLLNTDYFKQFYNSGITTYQITLDGWNHDKTRPLASGKGTLQTILSNLVSLATLPRDEYQFYIIIRHNILPSDEDFSWYDYLYNLFGNDDRFSVLIRPVGDWGGESVHSLNVLTGPDRDYLTLKHIEYLKKIGMQCENGAKGLFSKICCASYPHSMVFRSNGKIEKCTVALDHPLNQLGYIDSNNEIILNDEINKLWSLTQIKAECHTCPDILSCLNMQCQKARIIDNRSDNSCSQVLSTIY